MNEHKVCTEVRARTHNKEKQLKQNILLSKLFNCTPQAWGAAVVSLL